MSSENLNPISEASATPIAEPLPLCAGCGKEFPSAYLEGTPGRCAACRQSVVDADAEKKEKAAALEANPPNRYRVLGFTDSQELERAVNSALASGGWQLHGGIKIVEEEYIQVLTRSKDDADNEEAKDNPPMVPKAPAALVDDLAWAGDGPRPLLL
jgi:hypothetical protein